MRLFYILIPLFYSLSGIAQIWKVLPKGVRAVGYRNVTTSKITQNFNQYGQGSPIGSSFKVDASTLNELTGNVVVPGVHLDREAYNNLIVGEYAVDAQAQMNVHGTGFGYGITNKLMFFASVAYYQASVKSKIVRTAGNSYEKTSEILEQNGTLQGQIYADNLRKMIDANENTIQSVITNYYGYKPIGDWHGQGYGDMETGMMANLIDKGVWGLTIYPGVVLPTGYVDDPDTLQDVGFGDGQFDFFGEMATGYIVNDHLSFGGLFRYTYQAPTTKKLRVPAERDFTLSDKKGDFSVKYGDKFNIALNTTVALNDWISFTPAYSFMYQLPSTYQSSLKEANGFLEYNTEKKEHQVQLTTSLSSVTPFLKKKFVLPAQININLVKTVAGKNVPAASRFEVEFRMIF